MKNHKMVDGKLIQTNKKYSHLKLKQKEKIHQWMYESYRDNYLKTGKYPEGKECDTILEPLEIRFSVCKVENYKMVDIDRDFCFIGKTDEERSLVCPVDMVPDNTTVRDDGWKCFRICGLLHMARDREVT